MVKGTLYRKTRMKIFLTTFDFDFRDTIKYDLFISTYFINNKW